MKFCPYPGCTILKKSQVHFAIYNVPGVREKKKRFVSGRWPENLNAKCVFFFFFFFWRGAKVNFQVNIHIIIQMVDEFVPSYVPFPMQLLLQSIYLLNICAFIPFYMCTQVT